MREAKYWHAEEDGHVRCDLCPHACRLAEGRAGLCRVRQARGGRLFAAGYGLVSSAHVDPIEKKPLYHYRPGAAVFSVGGWGCNFACDFCQNWTISQAADLGGTPAAPETVVGEARRSGSPGIAYTYNEPLVGCEFVADCARLARDAGLFNVLVTNGYVQPGPAAALLPLIDALNVDVKSMDDAFYRAHCRARLEPVLAFCRQAVAAGRHVEITNLVIPGLNDGDAQVAALAEWVRDELGPAVPLHLSGYHPQYRLRVPATPAATLQRARAICRRALRYVYLGNVIAEEGCDTDCPGCGATLVRRRGYRAAVTGLRDGACAACGRAAEIVAAAPA
jgi:pyruvate formate lyase activating enzyme